MRILNWRVCVLYIMNPTFEGSGHVWSLDFLTWAFGWKYLILSWKYLTDMLISLRVPFKRRRMLTLWGFALRIPLSSHLLNLSLYRTYLPLFQGRPRDSLVGSLEQGKVGGKYMAETSSTPLW